MRVTIRDVAKACGVSCASVSMALGDKRCRLKPETVKHIRETAEKMNYRPNHAAASLAGRPSRMIGVVLEDIRNPHIAQLYMVISGVLRDNGFMVVGHITENTGEEEEERLVSEIASENLCALIWGRPYEPDRTEENNRLYERIDALGIPVFTMGGYEFASPGVNVCFDYEKAGYLAARHLLEAGHVRIGCVSGPKNYEVSRQRLEGYFRALREAGIEPDPKLVFEGDYTREGGSRALPYLMGQGVTAIFAQNDEMAFGIYRSARVYGIRIPEELSLIGCDNVPFDDVLEIPLSTVEVPTGEMGSFIGKELVTLLQEEEWAGGTRRTVYYDPDLYLRGSVRKVGEGMPWKNE